uniref:uncharacterized protein LOC122593159 isoform X2 n=1 Tax=Erigeron canadensis TaxID=72917 RepID=UPI001CB95F8B|nr:uncharacterized protein LOC122593159 isoform X2 [Erigeron canadensis]
MSEAPSLISLCIKSIKDAILDENENLSYLYQLPPELFDQILPNLPPLALQFLQDAMPSSSSNDDDSVNPLKKRKRFEGFDEAWKILYKSRWPEDVQRDDESNIDWQQLYWEKHLQNCLNATLESVSITLFGRSLGEVDIPDTLLQYISHERCVNRSRSYSKLTYHCERFGLYARCLRLQSVHCAAELVYLLRNTRLESLDVHWLKSKHQVDGLCKLLEQNNETLKSIEFVSCKLLATLVSAICDSLHVKGFKPNVIESFSIKRSSFLDSQSVPLPLGLESFLMAASNLTSLILSDNHMSGKTAKMVFDTLLDAKSGLRVLDLSENNISGWLSHIKWVSKDRQANKYMKSLRVLNLRSNNLRKDDVDCLKYAAMVYMPNLEVLNLSDNPLQYNGVSILVSYLKEKSNSDTPLAELHLENCQLYSGGGLLDDLAALNVPLKALSIGDNPLSSFPHNHLGAHLGRFLCSGIQAIDIKRTGLGKSGFSDAQKEITKELNLVHINISGNAGSVNVVEFLSKVISQAPNLISVDASSNWIPMESVPSICSFLNAAKGKLGHLDLQNNPLCNKPGIASLLAEFQLDGKPNILISSPQATHHYDNDP